MAKKKNVFLTPEQEQAATSLGITNLNSQNDLDRIDKYIADQAKKKAEQDKKQKNQPKAQPSPASQLQVNQGAGRGGGKITAWNEERTNNEPPPPAQGTQIGRGGGRPAQVKDDQFERLGIKPTDSKNLNKGQRLALTFDNIRNIATSGPQPGGGAGRDGNTLTPKMQALKSGSAYNRGLAVAQKQNPNQKFPEILPGLGRITSVNEKDNKKPAAPAAKKTTPAPAPKPGPAPTPRPGPAPTPGPKLKPSTVAAPELQRGPSSVVRNKAAEIRARLSPAQKSGRTKLGTNQLRIGKKSAMSGTIRKRPIAGEDRRSLAVGNRREFQSRIQGESFRDSDGSRVRLNDDGSPRTAPASTQGVGSQTPISTRAPERSAGRDRGRRAPAPAAKPGAKPKTPAPAAKPGAKVGAKPGAKTGAKVVTPAAKPGAKPKTPAAAKPAAVKPAGTNINQIAPNGLFGYTNNAANVAAATKPVAVPAAAKAVAAVAKPGAVPVAAKPAAVPAAKPATVAAKPAASPISPAVAPVPKPTVPSTAKPAGTKINQIAPNGLFGYTNNAANVAAATKPAAAPKLGIAPAPKASPVAAASVPATKPKKPVTGAGLAVGGIRR